MSDEEEETETPKQSHFPDCEGKSPVETAGGFNVIGWTECSECSGYLENAIVDSKAKAKG